MCNGTWVCFECRLAVRRPTWRHVTHLRPWLIGSTKVGHVPCPKCGQQCRFLGPTVEIPPKRDISRWHDLQMAVETFHLNQVDSRFRDSVRRQHDLEQRIRELQGRPRSPGRDHLIKELRARLAAGV
jgi:hypothetical protein